MKSSQITLIVIGFILLALMATNPSIEDHRQAVIEKMKEKIEESSNSESKNEWQKAGEAIGMAIGQGFLEKAVSRNNYLLFSLTKVTFGDNVKQIGVGAFGNVFIFEDYDDVKDKFSETKNEIISISPKSISLFERGVDLYYGQKDYEKAESVLKDAIYADENNYKALVVLSDLLINRYYVQNYEKALNYINKAINIKPNLDTCYFQRGMIYLDYGKHLNAIDDFTKTISLNPKYADAFYYRALIYGGDFYADEKGINDKSKACSDINSAIGFGMSGIDHYKEKFCH
jgi:tetratricopeptide (TPR) repeat protein